MKQGVTSFTNEVVIGAGSWIANGCVIVGNVKIGRGCVIGANSVVLDDIPDYCVAAGNPAKVKKYFDKISGKWVKVNDNWNMEEYNNKIKNMKPLLTIGIPTYNRSYFLERCLDNIFRQIGNDSIVEVLVSDNASSDATQKVVEKYKQEYKNLRYNRNSRNLGLMGNTRKVYELAKGVFINAHGDDDYYNDDVIYNIVDIIYKNIDSSIIYTLPQTGAYSIQNGYGIDEYLKIISFMTTFVTGLIIKNDKYTDIQDKTKYDGTELDLVYFQMELLKNREKFTVMHGKILNSESGQHRQTGNPYNFGKVFIEYYLNILMKYIDNGLELQTFKDEKVKLINNMIIPWVNSICNNQAELGINNFEEIFTNYFKDEPYFEEKFKIIKHILDKKVSC
nr:glycosyltransferase [Clostridium beijerinckii]